MKEAANQSAARMRDAKQAFEDGTRVLKEKAAHGMVAAGKVIDQGITNIRNLGPSLMPSTPEGMVLKETVENQRIVENKVQDILSKFDVNLGTKGTGKGITKDEYKKLRKKTPSNDIRKMVNPDGPKVDPVYGYEVDKFEADHIVSMKVIIVISD